MKRLSSWSIVLKISILLVLTNPIDEDIYWIGLTKESGAWEWSDGSELNYPTMGSARAL